MTGNSDKTQETVKTNSKQNITEYTCHNLIAVKILMTSKVKNLHTLSARWYFSILSKFVTVGCPKKALITVINIFCLKIFKAINN